MDNYGFSVALGVVGCGLALGIFIVFIVFAAICGYLFAITRQTQKAFGVATQQANEALAAARSLQGATIINRIVEKYNVVAEGKSVSDEAKRIEESLAEMALGRDTTPLKKDNIEALIRSGNILDPKSLV